MSNFVSDPPRILPQEVKKLTKTGKLSVSQMPITQYYELEQHYVCSCMLRIARELFNLLPLDHVYVHATEPRLNTAIGKVELATLVSARIERSVFESLNLQAIDPSDAMSNFTHRMKFLNTSRPSADRSSRGIKVHNHFLTNCLIPHTNS